MKSVGVFIVGVLISLLVTGCAVNLPFADRLSYTQECIRGATLMRHFICAIVYLGSPSFVSMA